MKAFRKGQSLAARAAGAHVNAVLGILLLMTILTAVVWMRRDFLSTSHGPTAAKATLAIEPFEALDSQPISWDPTPFADSLATRLASVGGLSARVVARGRSRSDFTLSGEVRVIDGRLMVSTRLVHSGERFPVWSGTFWRSRNSLDNFVDDVAAGVAEALYADIARRALTTTRDRS
jgi:hypothetical protein